LESISVNPDVPAVGRGAAVEVPSEGRRAAVALPPRGAPSRKTQVDIREAVQLGAADTEFFGRFFFPKTCRQPSPAFQRELDEALDDTDHRYVSAMVFRGGAKTSRLRLYVAKRIAYGLSRTILFVGKSQEHAVKSLEWLQNAVEYNKVYAGTFGLRKGKKWTGTEIEIYHGTDDVPIRIIALGITGSVRGVNVDDYRPDLIVVDDPADEENTATPEQRKKVADLFFGALAKSLTPRSEAPHAKMVLLQTVLNGDDLISLTVRDPQWKSLVYGCFDENKESRWPERFPTKELLEEKNAHIARNQLSLWLREMECKVVSQETSAFLASWLQYWVVIPEGGITLICCDPTPPPKDDSAKRLTTHLDDAVVMVIRIAGGNVYVCDYYCAKSPDPDELISKIFEFATNWRCQTLCLETILFQRVLAKMLEKEMLSRRQWLTIKKVEDKRKKETRIRQEVSSRASHRRLFVHPSMVEFIEQYTAYPDVKHDDILDCLTIGLTSINPWMESTTLEGEYTVDEEDEEFAKLSNWRGSP
jgi:predicted phage terminase large subunit-like protein